MEYQPGDILQLSEEGLEHWLGNLRRGREQKKEQYRQRRWEFLRIDPILIDKWFEKTLSLRRIDLGENAGIEHWSRRLMEKANTPRKEKIISLEVVCGVENPCCDRRGEYNGFGSGELKFVCPKHCSCHD